MPLYEYACPSCGTFEVIRKFSDDPLALCPTCSSPIEKLFSAPAFHLKGTGWYLTDYARKGQASGDGSGSKADAGNSASPGSDSKSTGPTPATPSTSDSRSSNSSTSTPAKTPTPTSTASS